MNIGVARFQDLQAYTESRIWFFYETTNNVKEAIAREKQIKGWVRKRKIELIESVNPEWEDLAADWDLELRTHIPREFHLYVMLNEVKHLVL